VNGGKLLLRLDTAVLRLHRLLRLQHKPNHHPHNNENHRHLDQRKRAAHTVGTGAGHEVITPVAVLKAFQFLGGHMPTVNHLSITSRFHGLMPEAVGISASIFS
jgi:hypothetical protein